MNLKLDGWNIPNKEEFVKLLISVTHSNFAHVVEDGRATKEEYWDYLHDLNEYSKHFLGVNIYDEECQEDEITPEEEKRKEENMNQIR